MTVYVSEWSYNSTQISRVEVSVLVPYVTPLSNRVTLKFVRNDVSLYRQVIS